MNAGVARLCANFVSGAKLSDVLEDGPCCEVRCPTRNVMRVSYAQDIIGEPFKVTR
jgi:hypothetical protein